MEIRVATMSMQGKREKQQDSYCYKVTDDYMLGCLCDGMGGLSGGEHASRLAADLFVRNMSEKLGQDDITSLLREEVAYLDEQIFELRDQDGNWMEAGTTMAAVVIHHNYLHWLSVGDSKIFIIRKGDIECIVREHNYKLLLAEKLRRHEISKEMYKREMEKGEHLISYLGMGNVSMVDINNRPFVLQSGDKILLCSDGVYRSFCAEDMKKIIDEYGDCIEIAVHQIENEINARNVEYQDNATAILISCR